MQITPVFFFYSNSWKIVHHKITVGINNGFKYLNNNKLTLNIRKSVYVAFSIDGMYIFFDDFIIHSCDNEIKISIYVTAKKPNLT